MSFSSLIALEHRFLKFHHFLELEKIRILVRFQKRVLRSFTYRKFWKTGKNGYCPCILCWKAVGTLGTNCRWRCPHLRMSGITHSTHAARYQVRPPESNGVCRFTCEINVDHSICLLFTCLPNSSGLPTCGSKGLITWDYLKEARVILNDSSVIMPI